MLRMHCNNLTPARSSPFAGANHCSGTNHRTNAVPDGDPDARPVTGANNAPDSCAVTISDHQPLADDDHGGTLPGLSHQGAHATSDPDPHHVPNR